MLFGRAKEIRIDTIWINFNWTIEVQFTPGEISRELTDSSDSIRYSYRARQTVAEVSSIVQTPRERTVWRHEFVNDKFVKRRYQRHSLPLEKKPRDPGSCE